MVTLIILAFLNFVATVILWSGITYSNSLVSSILNPSNWKTIWIMAFVFMLLSLLTLILFFCFIVRLEFTRKKSKGIGRLGLIIIIATIVLIFLFTYVPAMYNISRDLLDSGSIMNYEGSCRGELTRFRRRSRRIETKLYIYSNTESVLVSKRSLYGIVDLDVSHNSVCSVSINMKYLKYTRQVLYIAPSK